MNQRQMAQRRRLALRSLQTAVNHLGPITDVTRHAIREPILDTIVALENVAEELGLIRFDVYRADGSLKP